MQIPNPKIQITNHVEIVIVSSEKDMFLPKRLADLRLAQTTVERRVVSRREREQLRYSAISFQPSTFHVACRGFRIGRQEPRVPLGVQVC